MFLFQTVIIQVIMCNVQVGLQILTLYLSYKEEYNETISRNI